MSRVITFLFSQTGCVGRRAWWGMLAGCTALSVAIALAMAASVNQISNLSSPAWTRNDTYLQSLSIPERNKTIRDLKARDLNIISGGVAALLLLFWTRICVDVKRWHDLDMSGFMVWIGIVPIFIQARFGPAIGGLISLIVGIGLIYCLGFRPGVFDGDDEHRNPPPSAWAIFGDLAGAIILVTCITLCIKAWVLHSTLGDNFVP